MKAIILNLSAWAILPFMDTIAKYLSAELSFFQITWARYFFTVFWTLPFMFIFFRKNLTWSENPKLQILRGITLLSANICFFYSISIISMAKALTLAFIAPLVTTALSTIILGENVGIKRWSAVFLGFVGMLLIVQPIFTDFNYFYLSPVIFCIFFACVAISVKSLSKTEPNYTIAFYFTFLCTLLGLASLFFEEWKMPTLIDWIIIIVMGLCGSIANLLLTQSFRLADASLVTPIKYLSLVFAIVFGFLIWSEVPKVLTLFGALLVVLSSLIIFVREKQLKKQIISPRT